MKQFTHTLIIAISLIFINNILKAQKKFEVSGYLSSVQSVNAIDPSLFTGDIDLGSILDSINMSSLPQGFDGLIQDVTGDLSDEPLWIISNTLHNRINLNWYPKSGLKTSLQIRNQLVYGDMIRMNPLSGIRKAYEKDYLSWNISDGVSHVLNTSIDRLWVEWNKKDLAITAGRQRINWGQTFAWNPNDIFNTYNFFEVDYPERPGSDAIRIQYYTGFTSSVEFVAKTDSFEQYTFAGLAKFNKWNYDIQFLAGLTNLGGDFYHDEDVVIGTGWSGYIKDASFRGEASYFHPRRDWQDSTGVFLMSLSGDYTFENSLFLQTEFLYANKTQSDIVSGVFIQSSESLNVKSMAFAKYSFLLQASYNITPLLTGSLGGMYFNDPDGFYIGPSLTYSLGDNVTLSAIMQSFHGKFIPGSDDYLHSNTAYLQFKWNF